MNLYRISQPKPTGYDTYDSAVVCAESKTQARLIHPGKNAWDGVGWTTWCSAKDVKVQLIGEAIPGSLHGVICASFNAG
jgi:hypothetical protein